jgi:AcrR family transcriptional regulator
MRKGERKRQLLAQAKQLFVTLGYPGTTIEQVAAAAGVKTSILLRHFDSKLALLREVIEEMREATLRRWQTETASLTDPLARLHAIIDLYLSSTGVHAVEWRIVHRALLETEESWPLLRSFYLESEALLAALIVEGQQSGVFRRSLDPRVAAWELIRTALSYTLTLPLGLPVYAEPDYVPRAIDCLLHGLLKTDV